jgi:hypothetical protein
LLSAEGKLFAWQKLSATEAGAFRMVAEFDNASLAPRAVNRCNGKQIGVSFIINGLVATTKLTVD